ncbi:uncharacterized protein Z518_07207 [Rhinocladiella mackenziei CBS 650.93]|uniref:Rhinocladiella mackenziei CBS 650.93 unplaced genomic scaffold supercont1.5, whole genome shotgun sequence n=1 Tax=Rhinocladiella mackenziei CBS 650.93 TaxID=1442369 RepID=A0A0D2ICR7_9EURO|nr:uncharacterized protein Z518_07207 [Rhinocladiella mackenziei CBS 650.93]KIX03654.1 hypothetical protein Z518_07207 [Rhinocladiella mackenziei CBS 650.93]
MVSFRRTKNLANDGQTPMFLYTILKQLDLRSIDWNQVANALDISNGHAARMRYSRMRSQFEGISNQPKPPRAEKEKDEENKSFKDKSKGKRQLQEEENERLANEQNVMRNRISQDHYQKKIRLEPSSYMDVVWAPSLMNATHQDANMIASYPIIKVEPSYSKDPSLTAQSATSSLIKKDPDSSTTTSSQLVTSSTTTKQEPDTTMHDHDLSGVNSPPLKKEANAFTSDYATPVMTRYNIPTTGYGYPLSSTYVNTRDPAQFKSVFPVSMGMPSVYQMPQTTVASTYVPFANQHQTTAPWTRRFVNPHAITGPLAGDADDLMLNPHANSYEQLLNMSLDNRQTLPPNLQVRDSSHACNVGQQSNVNAVPSTLQNEQGISRGLASSSVSTATPWTLSNDSYLDATTETSTLPPSNSNNSSDSTLSRPPSAVGVRSTQSILEEDTDTDADAKNDSGAKTSADPGAPATIAVDVDAETSIKSKNVVRECQG